MGGILNAGGKIMYCSKCGNEIENVARFCPYCGQPVQQPVGGGMNEIPNERAYNQPNHTPYTSYNAAPANRYTNQYSGTTVPTTQQGMMWYKFVIYFQLFAAMIMSLGNGIVYFTGAHYQGNASLIYLYYGNGLHTLDIFMGITQFALIPLLFYVRQQLKNFKRSAPMIYVVTLTIELGIALIYAIAAGAIIGSNLMSSTISITVIANLVMAIVNFIYFKKREHLFVN